MLKKIVWLLGLIAISAPPSAAAPRAKQNVVPQAVDAVFAMLPAYEPPSYQQGPLVQLGSALRMGERAIADPAKVEQLVAMGPKIVPPLKARLTAQQAAAAPVVAQALARLTPAVLAEVQLQLLEQLERSAGDDRLRLAHVVGAGAAALQKVADPVADKPFLYAIGAPQSTVSTWALNALRKRFDARPDALIDAIFTYLSRRDNYSEDYLRVVQQVIITNRAVAVAGVRRNLERMLAEAQGKPAAIFWARKYVGLSTCWSVCDATAVPVLHKFIGDPSSYESQKITRDLMGGEVKTERTENTFAALARAAIDQASKR